MDRAEEVAVKLGSVRAWLDKEQLGGLLLASQANFAWITAGGHSHISLAGEKGAASVLITAHDAIVNTTNIERRRLIDEELPKGCFETIEYPWHEPGQETGKIEDFCDPGKCVSDLPGMQLRTADADLAELRRVLMAPEVERYRELAQDAAAAVESVCRLGESGDSELEIAGRVASLCYERDILPLVNLVAADHRIQRYRHPLPSPNRIRRTLLVALTGRRAGLHASLTRMVSFGETSAELQSRQAACARIDARMILESRPGRALSDVFQAGIEQYGLEGFPHEWKLHHQGGLTGYAGREVFAGPSTAYSLRSEQALAWNPSITGAKSEDTILAADAGPQVLTRSGHWPELEIALPSGTMPRPALLVR